MIDIKRIMICMLLALALFAGMAAAETANRYDVMSAPEMAEVEASSIAELAVAQDEQGAIQVRAMTADGGEIAFALQTGGGYDALLIAGLSAGTRLRIGGIGEAGVYSGIPVYIEGDVSAITVRADENSAVHISGVAAACDFVGGAIVLHDGAEIAALYLLGADAKTICSADGGTLASAARAEFEALAQVGIAVFDPAFLPE